MQHFFTAAVILNMYEPKREIFWRRMDMLVGEPVDMFVGDVEAVSEAVSGGMQPWILWDRL
jgi:hypothetical protein